MSRRKILLVSFESIGDGSAPKLHVDGTNRRLRSLGYDDVRIVASEGSRLRRWASVLTKASISAFTADVLILRFHPLCVPLIWLARLSRTRCVALVQGVPEDALSSYKYLNWVKKSYVNFTSRSLRLCDGFTAATPGIADWLRDSVGVAAQVLPNGVDADVGITAIPQKLPGRYVCFVGALASWQGVNVMMQAVSSAEWPRDVSLVVAGDGPCGETVRASTDPRVVYLGHVPSSEARFVMSKAIACLSPKILCEATQRGVSPFKVLEAASLGVPVVVTRIDGQWEGVEKFFAGIIVEPGSGVELARAVDLLASDRELRDRCATGSRELGISSNWESSAGVLDAVVRGHA